MKTVFQFSIAIVFALLSFNGLQAQKSAKNKVVTTQFRVEGVCGMCKERIENAALIKGVKKVDWDQATRMLTVIYKPSKVNEMTIHQSIANAGHDTDKVKAPEEVYKKMDGCCDYRGGVESH
jgi:copper chaperone CopZ